MLTTFKEGLKDSLRQRLLHVTTEDVRDYMSEAIRIEQQLREITDPGVRGADPTTSKPNGPIKSRPSGTSGGQSKPLPPVPGGAPRARPATTTTHRPMVDREKERRRANNLCYGCGGDHFLRNCPKAEKTAGLRANVAQLDDDGDMLFSTVDESLNNNQQYGGPSDSEEQAEDEHLQGNGEATDR